MQLKDIAEKIRELETFYADRLASNADHKELESVWKKIQDLRTLQMLTETFESIPKSPRFP